MISLKQLFIIGGVILFSSSCSDDENTGSAVTPPVENTYKAPSYADDYTDISAWTNCFSWNLANVHDPTVEKCDDYYYMYGTDASYGNAHEGHGHFPFRRSKDLVNWDFLGMAMTSVPAWVKDTLNNMRSREGLAPIENPSYGFWAPVVRKVGNKYRMYYSIIIDNYISTGLPNTTGNFETSRSWTERSFIGMMETDNLASNIWLDRGMVVSSVSDRTDWSRSSLSNWDAYFLWNAIDPTFIADKDGKDWLIYGSWHSGIVAVELDRETGKPHQLNTLSDYGTRIARRGTSRWQASEGPEIIYNEKTGYYYLFLAYDELSVAYNTRVCRSTSITGPYYGIDGRNVGSGNNCWPVITHPYKFNEHSGWVGISHCGIFQDTKTGDWYYSSQGRLPANANNNANSNAIMMGHVRSIQWTEDGWPVVMPERYAGVPQDEITEDDLIGAWEFILLKYSYGVQQTPVELVLSADKTASGGLTGAWSYDASKKILTIGSEKVCVQRELDWEANPRVATIVFAGLSSITTNCYSLWGKKIN